MKLTILVSDYFGGCIRDRYTKGEPKMKKGAGVLRDKPGIDWKKDRGRDVPSAPW